MKKHFFWNNLFPLAVTALILSMSCSKNESLQTPKESPIGQRAKPALIETAAFSVGDTILNVDYESGTTNSGYANLEPSSATASDAVYMVSPGATGNYAVAHKVVYGDSSYYSDGNWRSESATNAFYKYAPGEERRYEFSVLLKDWVPFNGTDASETSVFQLKVSAGKPVPLMVRTKRNALQLRYGNMDLTNTLVNVINDVRPYVNQWIHFRVDVKWTTDATGYLKTYMKLPGQNSFALADEKTNRRTFTGDPAVGNVGYLKWGAYVTPVNVTRIVFHDDIRVIALN